ncbi:hypothetical protein HPP92_019190 [Vanilla planifolia]|uniref:non-specific serine/threonine protein kinase n=1 Tax=Vanilla planifolia TaxID=51239 RepID=A0A835UMP0_VANPL|nr:hypothetical protein HPP92_019190 [Vanilla planifolia]
MDISIQDVVRELTSANVIGTGSSGMVYRVGTVAVKKMWSEAEEDDSGAFRNEIEALGSIRHRNIVRLLGYAANRRMKLLFYNYLPNGSLSSLLNRGGKAAAGWEERYGILLGLAEAVAYLHHDCVPSIVHGDVKSMNVLLGSNFEPYLADFGLARVLSAGGAGDGGRKVEKKDGSPPRIAGSYGYMAPEHASMQEITEKIDVYSYGVVMLEVLIGKHPLDPSIPDARDDANPRHFHSMRGATAGRPAHYEGRRRHSEGDPTTGAGGAETEVNVRRHGLKRWPGPAELLNCSFATSDDSN